MNLSQRLKQIRNELNLSQEAFGATIGVSRSVIKNIERELVNPNNLLITHLCEIHNINEQWLNTGQGEMLKDPTASILDQVAKQFDLGEHGRKIMEYFVMLPKEQKDLVEELISKFVETYEKEEKIDPVADFISLTKTSENMVPIKTAAFGHGVQDEWIDTKKADEFFANNPPITNMDDL